MLVISVILMNVPDKQGTGHNAPTLHLRRTQPGQDVALG